MPQFSRKKTAKPRSLNLYWVTTDDHDQDWFVIAASRRAAEKWFEDYEGYDQYPAAAELIMKVPPEIALHNTPGPRWADREHPSFQKTSRYAQIEDLAKLGFIILKHGDHGRTVKLGNRTFMKDTSNPYALLRKMNRRKQNQEPGRAGQLPSIRAR